MPPQTSCPCSGKNLAKLIHPAVLTALLTGDMHGYEILQRLGELRLFAGTKPDARGVYRTLQGLEDGEFVSSTWMPSEGGPDKRLYHITDKGVHCARTWIGTLRRYRLALDELLTTAEDAYFAARPTTAGPEEGRP